MSRSIIFGAAAACLLLSASGCTGDSVTPMQLESETAFSAALPPEQELARVIALAMRNPGVREAVRNAMRDSRYTEHKLALGDYLATSSGKRMLTVGAHAAGVSRSALLDRIAMLPELDFYLPYRSDRLTWDAHQDVVIATTLDEDTAPAAAFTPQGRLVSIGAPGNGANATLILIQPAEPKGVRTDSEVAGTSRTVEQPGENGISGSVTVRYSNGVEQTRRLSTAEVSSLETACPDGAFLSNPGMYISELAIGAEADGAGQAMEIQFGWSKAAYGSTIQWTYQIAGITAFTQYCTWGLLAQAEPTEGTGNSIEVAVRELDSSWFEGGHEDLGWTKFTYLHNGASLHTQYGQDGMATLRARW